MPQPSYREAFKFWLTLGFISFGGPAGQIAIMHEYLVSKKKWISEGRFMHALNYCMLLPGPEAQQMATYTGWLLHGTLGGLTAGLLFILPSLFFLLGLSILYVQFAAIPWIYSLFEGLKPAVIAIIILALLKIGKRSLHTYWHMVVAIGGFVGIYFFNIPFPLIIISSVLIGILIQFIATSNSSKIGPGKTTAPDEKAYYINEYTQLKGIGFQTGRLVRQIFLSILLWSIPLVLFFFFIDDFQFWKTLSVFFTQAAFVTFGGAYAVLPYVAQVSVEKFLWLTNLQMVDGLALGETTPGPLIMVLVFVGFMAGYNQYNGSLAMGTLGLVTTAFYTFLPCFLFIFAGAPIIEKTRENERIKNLLSFVTAAVVGVILNLAIYLGKAVLFPATVNLSSPDYIALVWIIISLVAMYRMKVNMIAWIGVSAIFGLMQYLLTIGW